MEKRESMIKRTWTGKWVEPEQENAFCEPELDFEQMVAAQKSGVPSEDHLKCARHLHRVVKLENEEGDLPVSAVIYASAHGVYDLYINGRKADERILAPETTNYEKLLWYQQYDISEQVGESDRLCIDALLGDGWWIGRLGMAGSSCNYGNRLGFIMDLELTYPDGSVQVIGSDEQFLSCESFIRYSDLYIGEMQDGRAFDFIDGSKGCPPKESIMDEEYRLLQQESEEIKLPAPTWTPCVVKEYSTEQLAMQITKPVRVVQEISSYVFVSNPKGELVADFGRVLAGVVRIRVNADPGTVITLEHGEVLDAEGNYFSNIKGLYKDQKTRYICAGGEQTFVPHFTYQGFRYVRITGIAKEQIRELTALVYATPFEKLGEFHTDHEMMNGLQKAIENSTISNMISVPTDCPQREKLGWTGDISIFTTTGGFLYDLRNFLRSWLLQVRLDQAEDGEIPIVVPNHPCQEKMQRGLSGGTNSSAAWSDCCIFMPLNLYKIYGDISFLEENYDCMEQWMAYVKRQAKGHLWNGRFHFGDWLIPSLREEPDGIMKGVGATADIVGSCYYSLAAKAMVEICTTLGKADRAEYYQELAGKIDRALVKAYVYEDGRVGVHASEEQGTKNVPEDPQLQGLYVVMLKTDAIKDAELKTKMLQRLVDLIIRSNYTLDCGFASIGFLLDVLYENGFRDAAYKLLFSEKAPSWLYMIKNGATTIWENWRAIREDGTVTDSSFNHYAYGCVGEFMYRHIGGIEAVEPGFTNVRIAPDYDCGIHECSCSRVLPDVGLKQEISAERQRKIVCNWKADQSAGALHGTLHVEIPEGVTARIILPSEESDAAAGSYDYLF